MCNSADNTAPSLLVPHLGSRWEHILPEPTSTSAPELCLRIWRPATGVSEPARNLSKNSDRQQRSDLSHIKEKRRLTARHQVR